MWQISLTASTSLEAEAVPLLEAAFKVPAVVYSDALRGRTTVTVYPSALRRSPRLLRAELRRSLPRQSAAALLRIVIRKLPRENWAESWKRHFKPLEIGESLLIKPGWSRRRPRPGQRVVILDPGLSFGTGHHATTAFCLQQLTRCRRPKSHQSLLDIGTGSGILAIAAAKLGYSPITAFDFDPVAVRVGLQNARRNRVQHHVRPQRRDLVQMPVQSRRHWDVICANLMADLLSEQAEKIVNRLKTGGNLIVAGILKTEFRQICDIFETFRLTLVKSDVNREWQSGIFLRLPGNV